MEGNLLTIDFKLGGNSCRYIGSGWSKAEALGTWTDGTQSVLHLPLDASAFGHDCVATVRANAHGPDLPGQNVMICAGGIRLFKGFAASLEKLSFNVPHELVTDAGTLDLHLYLPNATSPRELGTSNDSRRLGLWFTSLVVRESRTERQLPEQGTLPEVRSYDLFDTLIARRCVDPREIFRMIERHSGLAGFADLRGQAEHEVAEQDYTLAAIYNRLHIHHGFSKASAEWLMSLELCFEFEQIIPISERCREVAPGDLIVSDMYLPRDFLERIVDQTCGLHFNPFVLSAHGKLRGEIWESLSSAHSIVMHTGDNAHSDLASPQAAGIPARLVHDAKRTKIEAALADAGYVPLTNLMREARLTTAAEDVAARRLQLSQIETNFPLLFIASLRLLDLACSRGWRFALLSARDGYLWSRMLPVLAAILGVPLRSYYFYTSRVARANPSASYVRYFNGLVGGESGVVADVTGTGWSMQRLVSVAGATALDLLVLARVENPALLAYYETLGTVAGAPAVESIFTLKDSVILELMNRAPHPMVEDVRFCAGTPMPVFSRVGPGEASLRDMRVQHEAFLAAVRLTARLTAADFHQMQNIDGAPILPTLCAEMGNYLGDVDSLLKTHLAEDGQVYPLLTSRAAAAALPLP